jgi:hypothetical protein
MMLAWWIAGFLLWQIGDTVHAAALAGLGALIVTVMAVINIVGTARDVARWLRRRHRQGV